MKTLILRNLTSTPIRVTRTTRLEIPAALVCCPPGTRPETDPIDEIEVSLSVPAYHSLTTTTTLTQATILHLEFELGSAKFGIDLFPGRLETPVELLSGDAGDTKLVGIFHATRGHLALVSSAILHRWMSVFHDATHLSALSMPGTHNSATYHLALPTVRCQAVDVTCQLNGGVRFLDIRVQADRDLKLVHGAFPIAIFGIKKLGDTMRDCYNFLERNPSETLVVSLKREGRGKVGDEEFSRMVHAEIIEKDPEKWYVGGAIPALGEVRGKCVLFRRFRLHETLRETGLGINAENWTYNTPNDTTASGICVQDFSEVREPKKIPQKLEYVKAHLERSSVQLAQAELEKRSPPLFLNFLSASYFWHPRCWPERIADSINPAVIEYLAVDRSVEGGNAGTGVVLTDFVGEEGEWAVCRLVVGMNAGLLLRGGGV